VQMLNDRLITDCPPDPGVEQARPGAFIGKLRSAVRRHLDAGTSGEFFAGVRAPLARRTHQGVVVDQQGYQFPPGRLGSFSLGGFSPPAAAGRDARRPNAWADGSRDGGAASAVAAYRPGHQRDLIFGTRIYP
jgi:hypothetical protein